MDVIEFGDGDSPRMAHMAFGLEARAGSLLWFRPAYEVRRHGSRRCGLIFPSCLKFMPYDVVREKGRMSMQEINDKYGPLLDEHEMPAFSSDPGRSHESQQPDITMILRPPDGGEFEATLTGGNIWTSPGLDPEFLAGIAGSAVSDLIRFRDDYPSLMIRWASNVQLLWPESEFVGGLPDDWNPGVPNTISWELQVAVESAGLTWRIS